MGKLIKRGNQTIYTYSDRNGISHTVKTGNYKNKHAVHDLIRYITRTRTNENRLEELKYWAAIGSDTADVNTVINQFNHVQTIMRNHTERKMYHFIYAPDVFEKRIINKDYHLAATIAYSQAYIFYNFGYQVVMAVHDTDDGNLHYHFAVNSVNYYTGKMFHYSQSTDQPLLEGTMTSISYNAIASHYGMLYPFDYQRNNYPGTMKAPG